MPNQLPCSRAKRVCNSYNRQHVLLLEIYIPLPLINYIPLNISPFDEMHLVEKLVNFRPFHTDLSF